MRSAIRRNWVYWFWSILFVTFIVLMMVGIIPDLAAEPGNWNDADPYVP